MALAGLDQLVAAAAQAVEVHFERVATGIYAFVGETGARISANEGLSLFRAQELHHSRGRNPTAARALLEFARCRAFGLVSADAVGR